MSYYDIDAILTDSEKIPCTFELDVPELGYLDNAPEHELKAGTTVSLPLWLAEMLALANATAATDPNETRNFVTLNLPTPLANDVVQALKADPKSVPVRDQSPHFYSLSTRILELFEEPQLAGVLRKTFVTRAGDVALHARRAAGSSSSSSGSQQHGGKGKGTMTGGGSNIGIGLAGEEFLRGLDEWERGLFRQAHDGTKAAQDWMDNVKKR